MDELDDLIKSEVRREVEAEKVPAAAIRRAQELMKEASGPVCPHCGKTITPFRRPLGRQKMLNLIWLALAGASFLLSFAFPRYFFQCLALTLLFGFKWVIDQKSTKTQILIYKALQEAEGGSRLKDLHETRSRL